MVKNNNVMMTNSSLRKHKFYYLALSQRVDAQMQLVLQQHKVGRHEAHSWSPNLILFVPFLYLFAFFFSLLFCLQDGRWQNHLHLLCLQDRR